MRFSSRLDSPQLKWLLISSTKNIVKKLTREVVNELRLSNLGDVNKLSKLCGHIA